MVRQRSPGQGGQGDISTDCQNGAGGGQEQVEDTDSHKQEEAVTSSSVPDPKWKLPCGHWKRRSQKNATRAKGDLRQCEDLQSEEARPVYR